MLRALSFIVLVAACAGLRLPTATRHAAVQQVAINRMRIALPQMMSEDAAEDAAAEPPAVADAAAEPVKVLTEKEKARPQKW